jgi:hypothetical protein
MVESIQNTFVFAVTLFSFGGEFCRMGDRRGAYRDLVGKPEEKRPLGRPRRRWRDNNKTNFREIGWGDIGYINLAQDRDRWRDLVNTVMNLLVP